MPSPAHRRIITTAALALCTLTLPAQEATPEPQQQPAAIQPPASPRNARAASNAYLTGARQLAANDAAAAQNSFARALSLDPGKTDYALSLAVAKEHHVTALIQSAAKARLLGHTAEADRLFAEARELDPDNLIVTQHLDQGSINLAIGEEPGATNASDAISRLAGPIRLASTPGTHSFHRRGDAQELIREVYTAYGIRPTFDPSLTARAIRFDLDDVDFPTAIRVLNQMADVFATPLDTHSVLIARDTQENHDRLTPQVEETFYLPGLPTEQLTELSNVAKNIYDLKQVAVQASGSRIVMRGSEDAMKLVNATFADLLDGGAEVMLQIRLYEVDKSHIRRVGADLPTSIGAFSIAAEAQSIVSANQSILQQAIAAGYLTLTGSPLHQLEQELGFLLGSGLVSASQVSNLIGYFGGGLTLAGVFLGSGASFNALLNSSEIHLLDEVQLRVADNQLGTFRSGTRYPITTSTYSSSVSSALTSALAGVKINGTPASALLSQYLGSSNSLTVPQIQYEDLGLTLKATPQALKSGDVHVHLDLKVEALGAGSLNGIPVLNQRTLTSDITVPMGGTALLASEVSSMEQHSIEGLPGLSEIPGFQGTDKSVEKDSGELLITITPAIVRRRSSIIASRRLVANVSVVEQ